MYKRQVVNKPKGMVVHPAPGNPDGTLVNALLWHCKGSLSGIGGEIRPGIGPVSYTHLEGKRPRRRDRERGQRKASG